MAASAAAFAISVLVRWPIVGYLATQLDAINRERMQFEVLAQLGICLLDEGNRMNEKSWASLAPLLDHAVPAGSDASGGVATHTTDAQFAEILAKYGTRRARAHAVYQTFLCREFVAEGLELMPSTEPNASPRSVSSGRDSVAGT